ncbi:MULTISPECIES: fructose-specific PTS transporter subunit EIIC [Bacillaceae]|uniref:fructose-specific PTS transporter subunit EIIC n=1 Tax=Bacillales TaxID=1385 RepID=UPI0018834C2F|nr:MULTISPECIES: fructose-specific PTS transporter subunit EIIC [Bacillaceae]MBF0707680.1 PTS sugar transporter subunit IIA [Pseudalkalibacillus hwajinpoensis]MDO6654547.1 fructose-specific PTS transporter subunit EIIC [Anaerobacillus sp. 1_MG-2023]
MELKNMTDSNLIMFDVEADHKEQVIKQLTSTLFKEGYLESEQPFLEAVLQREDVSPTGMERGLAIPHGKSTVVKKAVFAVARLTTPLDDWASIDPTNKVQLIFLIAIPESEAGTTHLKVLSTLSTNLMREGYLERLMASESKKEFLDGLDLEEKEETKGDQAYTKTVVAVTACATGIAHTYMAAEALEKAGRELGVNVLVEKQGANGIEDALTASVIEKADAVILATDIAPKQKERFAGKPYVQTRVAEPLRRGKEMIQKALTNPDGVVEKNESDDAAVPSSQSGGGFLKDTVQAVMTGISYMIPVIVAAGLMMGIAKLGAMPFGLVNELGDPKYATHSNELFVILHHLDLFGGLIFKFMYPIFAAFVAYSLADRVGLVSGFIGGAFAGGLHYTFWGIADGIPSGFLGALILGLAAGYISRFLNQKIQLSKNFQAMKPMFLIPAISVLSIFFLNFYIVDPVFGGLNVVLRTWIESAQGTGDVVLASIIAAATAFDLGGPINKAAGAIAIGLAADEVYPLTARVLAIVIPPIGLGLATVIDKYVVGRRVFEADLRVAGNTALLLGFIAISEGAIPFMLRNPLITIPINIIGAILGASTAVLLGAVQWLPLPAFWGWPLVENLWAYLLGLIVGAAFIAFVNIFVRFTILKKKESHA